MAEIALIEVLRIVTIGIVIAITKMQLVVNQTEADMDFVE
jgi:hypothetical protein